jgi:DNA-directed RNA polymerase specialized sigma24 family protein
MSWERICAEIEREPRLTADEERALRLAHLAGDARAKPKLIACTCRYALGIAQSMARKSSRWEPGDLLGIAVQAMSYAFDRWDGSGSFAGYVQARIRGSMRDFLRRRADVMRAPVGADRALSLDAPEGDDGRSLLDSQASPEVEIHAIGPALTKFEAIVLDATLMRRPVPATAAEAARALGLTEATVARALRSALRKRAASGQG